MRVIYLTIDNINDNVILAQTFPFLAQLLSLPDIEGVNLFALEKIGPSRYHEALPGGPIWVVTARNHGIWHPGTWAHLLGFAARARSRTRPGTLLIGRNPVSLLILVLAARRAGTRVVLDYRGLLPEEYVLQGKIPRRGGWHRMLRGLERWALRRADVVLCVSEHLRRRTARWLPGTAAKLAVIPCCYDPRLVRWDERAVTRTREALGVVPGDDFVLVYAGSLSAWNRPDAILNLFRQFRAAFDRSRLLLLSGDQDRSQGIFGGEPGVLIRSVPHEAIQPYLAVGDLGLLVRESHPVNRVASPVKFAEYLVSGLPVLVSRGVGDCAAIVQRQRVGYILGNEPPALQMIEEIRANRAALRARCRAVAARYFDRERYVETYRRLLVTEGTGGPGPH
jgi:glycosyltransferase involved in cell wall biosynthesis